MTAKSASVGHKASADRPNRRIRTLATALGGSAAFGLLAATALPAFPVAAIVAAAVGLVGGAVVTRLDKDSRGR
jgi:hypothetical protein